MTLRAALSGAIDYAGLFPPASLDMGEAARAFGEYRRGGDAWALGRFVVPLSRAGELAAALARGVDGEGGAWPLSVLLEPGEPGDAARLKALSLLLGAKARIECVEARAGARAAILALGPVLQGFDERFVELPHAEDPLPLMNAARDIGAGAKIRTGGVTADAFPSAHQVLRFMRCCREAGLPFKATAGLHHPIRAEYALTYDPGSGRATMFGFLNLIVGAAFVFNGATDEIALGVLGERDPGAFVFGEVGVEWRGQQVPAETVRAARSRFLRGFGSCSFREPLDELVLLGPH